MKNKYLKTSLVAAAVLFAGYVTYNSHQEMQYSAIISANLEALANPELTDCNNKNGYRQWSTSGFLEHKKEFYDCCSILQDGYSPKDNCR